MKTSAIASWLVFAANLMVCCVGHAEAYELHFKQMKGRVIRYFSDASLMQIHPDTELAVVQVHGVNGGKGDTSGAFRNIIKERNENAKIVFFAPCFPIEAMLTEEERDKYVYWDEGKWQHGFDSSVSPGVSAYDILDAMFDKLNDPKLYPRLRHVLFCGYSAGGQVIGRYVAVAKIKPRKGLSVDFAAGAPSTWLYLDDKRPTANGKFAVPDKPVKHYNSWHVGLEKPCRYASDVSRSKIMKNLARRFLLCFCGTDDAGEENLSVFPGAMVQGKNRYERFKNYQAYIRQFPKIEKSFQFLEIPGVGHNSSRCYKAPELVSLALGEKKISTSGRGKGE